MKLVWRLSVIIEISGNIVLQS